MKKISNDEIRTAVRENYGAVAEAKKSSCCSSSSCCGGGGVSSADISQALGYSSDDVSMVPDGANMGLGCGNPQAIASLRAGETVLDLGSGGGFDSFLAARAVGPAGKVIGVDMTPEMITKSRQNADKAGLRNVDFRLGEIEHLPVADSSIDVIISNCVINLSPEKAQVFREAFRVLAPGGRLAISDVVTTAELPVEIRNDMSLYTGCAAGASSIAELSTLLGEAGFTDVRIEPKAESREFIRDWAPGRNVEDHIVSASITAVRPK